MKNPTDEIIEIVNRNNRVIGSCPRSVMRANRHIHRACYILVFNTEGKLFVQKRTMDKDIYPGHWDVAAGGVVLAGETYEESAVRELEEELGVAGVMLTFLFDNYYRDRNNRVWGRVFSCTHNGPFRLQAEEIDYGRFMTIDEVLKLRKSEPFTPDGVKILKKIQKLDRQGLHAPILFLHGLDSSSRGTKGRFFTAKFPGIIAPDFKGSLEQRLQALETLCEARNDLILIGSSFGGLMATCFAQAHPAQVKKLILLAPALNFPEFTPPENPLPTPTILVIGEKDTLTPPELVLPVARQTFQNLQVTICDDDHLLHTAFMAMDWQRLLVKTVLQ